MSVTSLLKLPDVREQLRRLVPKSPSRITAPLVAPPLTRSYGLIGTAFDYAARFELERRFPHVRTKHWVADAALARLPMYSQDPNLLRLAKRVIADARTDIGEYTKADEPTAEQRAGMASHAIRLAKLDAIYRAGRVDPQMGVAEPADVRDVLNLLEIAPFDLLAHPTTLWLNPTFEDYSHLVGGADCDLVSGDRLIDIKVTKNDALDLDYLLQLVSYAILGRGAKSLSPEWPEVRHVGIYFARHGHLWTAPVQEIYGNPAYDEVEAWYFARAAQQFGTQVPGTVKKTRNGWPITPGLTPEEIAFLEEDGAPATDKPPSRKPAKPKVKPPPKAKTPPAKTKKTR